MKIFSLLICLIVLTAAIIFAQEKSDEIIFKHLHYLKGNWIIEGKSSMIHEQWKLENDSLLTAKSFYVVDGDTTNPELVRLEKIEDEIYYIPIVAHNHGPVKFKLTSLNETTAIFENPEHDFPTKIIYEKINDDSLSAKIEGLQNGKLKSISYPFKRVK